MTYRVRVQPDSRFEGVIQIAFLADRIYECESAYHTRRHMYGTGKWYVSPCRDPERFSHKGMFTFEDFEVVAKSEMATSP